MKSILILLLVLLVPVFVFGEENNWEFAVEGSLYILPDNTYLNPVLSADRSLLHLEARYNDEDLNTGSVFAGINLHTGNEMLKFTPMVGGVFGNSNGFAPGFLFELNYGKFSLSSEGEYFFSSDEKESNFFYSWSEFTYSPADWIWVGIAGQRTRAYQTDLDVQRGVLLGFGIENLSITGYLMNIGWDKAFGVINVGYTF